MLASIRRGLAVGQTSRLPNFIKRTNIKEIQNSSLSSLLFFAQKSQRQTGRLPHIIQIELFLNPGHTSLVSIPLGLDFAECNPQKPLRNPYPEQYGRVAHTCALGMCAAFSEGDLLLRVKCNSTLPRTHRKKRDMCATQSISVSCLGPTPNIPNIFSTGGWLGLSPPGLSPG